MTIDSIPVWEGSGSACRRTSVTSSVSLLVAVASAVFGEKRVISLADTGLCKNIMETLCSAKKLEGLVM